MDPKREGGWGVNGLLMACREAVQDLQKLCMSRQLPKAENDKLVEILRKLRCAMRRDYERRRFLAAMDKLQRGRPSDYPAA